MDSHEQPGTPPGDAPSGLTSPQDSRRATPTIRPPEISARFRAAARGSGIAQREIGRRIGMDESKLSKSINGQRRFQSDELFEFATVTGVTVSWLLTGTDSDDQLTAAPLKEALPARSPQAPADSEHRRRRLVEAAWTLFSDRGYEHVRLADIARAAEVSPSAIHYHFAGKWEIFAETMRYSVKLAYDRQLSELGEITDPVERLRALVRMQLPEQPVPRREWSIWVQMWGAAATSEDARTENANSYSRWERTVHELIADCVAAGACRPLDIDEETLVLTGLIDGLGIRVLSGLLSADRMRQTVRRHIESAILLPDRATPYGSPPSARNDPPPAAEPQPATSQPAGDPSSTVERTQS